MTASAVWHHVVDLATTLFITLAGLTAMILIVRLIRVRSEVLSTKVAKRTRFEVYLAYTVWGEVLEFSQALFSTLSVILYIYGTYLTHAPLWYSWIDLLFCIYFTFHWALDYYVSRNRLRYLYSFYSLVDLLTILPIYDNIIKGRFREELDTFQFLRVLRVIRTLRIHRLLHRFKNPVTRQLFKAGITVFTLIFLLAGFYMNIETNEDGSPLRFHETVYFLVVTLTTVGYGDIHPYTALGQITITLSISLGAVVLIPWQVSKLLEKITNYSPYNQDFSSASIQNHVVLLTEELIPNTLMEFLLEFYHERYGKLKKEVVILCPKPPSEGVKALLNHAFYKTRVFYLVGDLTSETDLMRTRFSRADACFLFRPPSWNTSDAEVLLSIVALRNMKRTVRIYPQLIKPDSKLKLPPNLSSFLCLEEFRGALLAQSCMCPGFSTLVCNLFTSRQILNIEEKWISEYSYGSIHSIYKFRVPSSLEGRKYVEVIHSMFEGTSALVIGLEVEIQEAEKKGKSTHIWLFPPLQTQLNTDMALVVIAHSIHAPNVRVDKPTIVRQNSVLDMEVQEASTFTKIYNKLFLPNASDDSFMRNDEDSMVKTLFNSPKDIELTAVGLNSWGNSGRVTSEADTASLIEQAQIDEEAERTMEEIETLSSISRQNTAGSGIRTSSVQQMRRSSSSLSTSSGSDDEDGGLERGGGRALISQSAQRVSFRKDKSMSSTSEPEEHATAQRMVTDLELTGHPALLRNVCEREFGGDWDDFLKATIETINKAEGADKRLQVLAAEIANLLKKPHDAFAAVPSVDGEQGLHGHIVVCGSVRGISSFLQFLRMPYMIKQNSLMPIVILTPHDVSDFPEHIASLPFVTWKKGIHTNRHDLEKCGVRNAAKVVVLSNPYAENTSLSDSNALLGYMDVRNITTNSQILMELVHEPYLKFLKRGFYSSTQATAGNYAQNAQEDKSFNKPDYYIIPEFASGQVCTFATMDSLLCQIFYQDHLVDIAKELVFGINGLNKAMMSHEAEAQSHTHCFCTQIPVPDRFHGQSYEELFQELLNKRDLLPLGLYRCKDVAAAPLPYVFTCPPSSTILHKNDKVFVLSRHVLS